jgi:RNA polymerase sigma-70 factor (ECF subfamily)
VLVDPFRRELRVHCYRILGSEHDAEDALQESLLAAWQGLRGFQGRASVRTWLYRIATNRCLNMLRAGSRREVAMEEPTPVEPPPPTRMREVSWLEPYPDVLLDELTEQGPEARYEARESVSLAFLTALQLLPARQRAAVVLADVLGYRAREVADILGTTEQAVKSALKRARATLHRAPHGLGQDPPPPPCSAAERDIVERFTAAYVEGDLDGVIALLTEDVSFTMPPLPFEYIGTQDVARFLDTLVFRPEHTIRLIPTRANYQPAFGFYIDDRNAGVARTIGLLVLTLAGSRIAAITRFEPSVLHPFGLPRTLPT